MSLVPSVDLSDFISGDDARKKKFIQEIGKALAGKPLSIL
jgi:hypothetical protein